MKIITYNVNGLRAAVRKGLVDWLKEENPDVLCIQETKLQEDQFDAKPFEELGYKCYLHCAQKKGYSGVAILSLREPDHIEYGMGSDVYDAEGRVLRADFGDLSVLSIYYPSGSSGDLRQAFKMDFLSSIGSYINKLRSERPNMVICGDYNICHEAIDIHDPVSNANVSGFLPEERDWMTDFLSADLIDSYRYLYPEEVKYSWWSYRTRARERNKGWRIDYCVITQSLLKELQDAFILNNAVHSDHCPTGLILSGR